jgi:hypothetical protein
MANQAPEETIMSPVPLKPRARSAWHRAGIALALVAISSLLSPPAFAMGSAEQRRACTGDVMKLCLASIGSEQALISCMTRNKDKLSHRCKMTLPPI